MGVDKQNFAICFGRVPVRASCRWTMPDKCDPLSAMAKPSLSRLEARTGMCGAGPAGWAGDDTENLSLSHGRYAV